MSQTKEKVLITGGNGSIATLLGKQLSDEYDVYYLSRTPKNSHHFVWNINKGYIDPEALKNTSHIIHLAGADIAEKAWTRKRKQEIKNSRILSTRLLFQQVQKHHISLKTFISASAIGYYGNKNNKTYTEKDAPSTDFLGAVCAEWEQEASAFEELGIRVVKVRIGIVLSKNFGVLPKILSTKKFFFIPLADGQQPIAWIHEQDLCNVFEFTLHNTHIKGAFNATAQICTNADMMRTLANIYKKTYIPIGVPNFILRLLLGERATLVTQGIKTSSDKIIEMGFMFKFTNLKHSLIHLLNN